MTHLIPRRAWAEPAYTALSGRSNESSSSQEKYVYSTRSGLQTSVKIAAT